MFHVISLKITNFMQIKNKIAQSFCRNSFHLWLDGSFQFQNCADSSETPYPSSTPTENNHMGFSPVRLVVMKILPQIVQDTSLTQLSPWKCHEESAVQHCWCEVWHHLDEIRLNSLACHTPSGKEHIQHSAYWGKQKWLCHRWTQRWMNISVL